MAEMRAFPVFASRPSRARNGSTETNRKSDHGTAGGTAMKERAGGRRIGSRPFSATKGDRDAMVESDKRGKAAHKERALKKA